MARGEARHRFQGVAEPLGRHARDLAAWFTAVFPAQEQATHLFDASLPAVTGLAPLPPGRADVLVSPPERALLELLSDVGKGQELAEARHLVEGARSLCLPVAEELLAHLLRIKVGRLVHLMAEELKLA
ncbi:type IV toxin-antitoxin system AbiEi family antitoxin domain-containing protein [Paucibacter sp. PLA-PC-4]|uniref:type IV toxin-antitoxin system AbiEi family antitoxin domain-containing protein n=1 Tax=Paucibacter sp. PLA-PC-4 TaxID=2993655 RepID=UPI00224ACA7C|nr:type IV toxin-antitoxin system AbiEi family antitoxin domain-containing protein [Paucibacter sp. PLA-PC-4]MCX2864906.1 type IV toxin-antitoxin system AbiEi family antitoxin domain-containing protein [Paucibacter sp. PLA-PC-4]